MSDGRDPRLTDEEVIDIGSDIVDQIIESPGANMLDLVAQLMARVTDADTPGPGKTN
ncbi:hypothetical protein ACIRF8_15335 [Streptomyces sp. NPDC102406]|uniref:hypothetical protein n=1 Tax=Streptomyces sp. NPDC102406 TaxID=3366171 RepID=UPI0037F8B459